MDAAAAAIAIRSGHVRDMFWIAFQDVAAVVDRYAGVSEPRRFEFTAHRGGTIDLVDAQVVGEADRNRCELVDTGPRWALVRNRIAGEGHATPTLERITGHPATSRGLPSMVRLVLRFRSR
ncbi:hypothetical protein NQ152_09765 [Microbacterium sp. zg.B48]|uniref:hypothetical protein n=1 Tax=Microbacterium sp. zg.B48 TaxID=2969408 RepID=UPI00214B14C2|nr:hypothetical protein [Microbacterium sp. zg.B48]MCR2763793.1 hypothetical protein [Microbacterium sp. zg.B48]